MAQEEGQPGEMDSMVPLDNPMPPAESGLGTALHPPKTLMGRPHFERFLSGLMLSWIALTTPAQAVEPCAPDPSPGAHAAPPDLQRLLAAAAAANRYAQPVALAATRCVGRTGLFLAEAEVPPADRMGPAARAPAFPVVAWLLGAHQFHFGGQRTDTTASLAGARFAGCALAHVGARGNDLTRQVQRLEAVTGPHIEIHAWRVALQAGYDRCAP